MRLESLVAPAGTALVLLASPVVSFARRILIPLVSSLRILVKGSSALSGVVVATTVGVFVRELARIAVAVRSPRVPALVRAGIRVFSAGVLVSSLSARVFVPLVPFLGVAVKAALSRARIVVTAPVGVTVRVIIALPSVGSVAIALLVQTRSTLRHFRTVLD